MKNKGLKILASVLIVLISVMSIFLKCLSAEWGGLCLMGLGSIAFILLIPILIAINFNIHWFLKIGFLFSVLAFLSGAIPFIKVHSMALFLFVLFLFIGILFSVISLIYKFKYSKFWATISLLICASMIVAFFVSPMQLAIKPMEHENIQIISSNSTELVVGIDMPHRLFRPDAKVNRVNCYLKQPGGDLFTSQHFPVEDGINKITPSEYLDEKREFIIDKFCCMDRSIEFKEVCRSI